MKRTLSIVLALILLMGCMAGAVSAAGTSFTDVKEGDYFHDPVQWAVENGITSGIGDNRFGPSNPCTRAQVVTFLWRAAGSPNPNSSANPFADVSTGDYFYTPVLWAVENGITAGVSANSFGPSQTCTRGQIVTFLWKFKNAPTPNNTSVQFSDVDVSAYYAKPVAWAVENGVTAGVGDGKFGPNQTCTRGQVMTFLYKAKDVASGNSEIPDATVPSEPVAPEEKFDRVMAKEVFDLVNVEREKVGAPALTYYEVGQPAADVRCEELNKLFSHTRPNGSSCFTVFDEMGLQVWAGGENIAMGYRTAADVMNGWMNSEGHRMNILNPDYTSLAVATDGVYWVQLFVKE